MPRKPRSTQYTFETLPSKDPAPAPAPPPGAERIAEYRAPDGAPWRVSRMDLLRAEWPDLEDLPRLHARISADARRWLVVRRLFGIGPVMVPADADPDDLRTHTREEVQAALGLTRPQLQAELDAVRGLLRDPVPAEAPEKATFREELPLADAEILERYGFSEAKFDQIGRSQAENRMERAWFCSRLREWSKVLEDRMAGQLARAALDNELHLRRAESELSRKIFGSKEYRDLLSLKSGLEESYQEQLLQIDKVCPWVNAASGKQSFVGSVSDLVRAYQQYYAEGSTALADGIFSATEVQVLMRRSVQAPEPQYRCGLVVYLNEAKRNLFDPAWKTQFTPAHLKKLDDAWRAASVAAGEAERLPDLESEDPVLGEYDPLHAPS